MTAAAPCVLCVVRACRPVPVPYEVLCVTVLTLRCGGFGAASGSEVSAVAGRDINDLTTDLPPIAATTVRAQQPRRMQSSDGLRLAQLMRQRGLTAAIVWLTPFRPALWVYLPKYHGMHDNMLMIAAFLATPCIMAMHVPPTCSTLIC